MDGLSIRCGMQADLDAVCALERATFPPAEAATRAQLDYRLRTFPERFLLGECDGRIVGMVNGCTSETCPPSSTSSLRSAGTTRTAATR